MTKNKKITLCLITLLIQPMIALGYGSSSSSSTKSCEEPIVSNELPAPDSVLGRLEKLELDISGNADPKTIAVEVDGVRQNPTLTSLRTGDQHLTITLNPPKTAAGKVQVTVRAKSDETCETFKPYYLKIQP